MTTKTAKRRRPPEAKVAAVMMVRNAVEILRISVLHHLSQGIDEIHVVDNGSTDGTAEVLRELEAVAPLTWSRDEGPFLPEEILTRLARDAFLGGADWIIPIDADEFWCAAHGTIKEVLAGSRAGALRARVVNFIQRRDQHERAAAALLQMTRRVARPVGPEHKVRELVEHRKVAFVEMTYPPKWISRASLALEIRRGNHEVAGLEGRRTATSRIVCLHAPLWARSVLEAKMVDSGARVVALDLPPDTSWHLRRWKRLHDEGLLDQEWRANSYEDDALDVFGENHPVVIDHRLRDAIAPWIDYVATEPRSGRSGDRGVIGSQPGPPPPDAPASPPEGGARRRGKPSSDQSGAALAASPHDAARYELPIDLDSDSTHARVVHLVGRDRRVLELGCSTGYMSRVLRDQGCSVVGVEIDAAAAGKAAQHCERVIVGDLEELDLLTDLGAASFDVVLAADILEHLRDPLETLHRLKPLLRPGGMVVASLPNIAHGSVRLALLTGRFRYDDVGLLDHTHLRFFTRESMLRLFEEAGFTVGHLERMEVDLEAAGVAYDASTLPTEIVDTVSRDPEARTFQFIVAAYPLTGPWADAVQHRFGELTQVHDRLEREVSTLRAAAARVPQMEKGIEQLRRELARRDEIVAERDRDLAFLKETAAANAAAAAEKDAGVAFLQGELKERDARLAARGREVQQLRKELSEASAVAAGLRADLALLEQQMLDRDAAIGERDKALEALRSELARRDAMNSELAESLRTLRGPFTDVGKELRIFRAELARRESDSALLREQADTLQEQIRARDRQLAEKEAWLSQLRDDMAVHEKTIAALEADVELLRDSEATLEVRNLQVGRLERQVKEQAEGIAWLRQEVALRESKLTFIYGMRSWRWLARYWALREIVARQTRKVLSAPRNLALFLGRRLLPAPVKNRLKRAWRRGDHLSPGERGLLQEAEVRASDSAGTDSVPAISPGIAEPVAGEGSPEAFLRPRAGSQAARNRPSTYDVVCFSIIDWDFRWQRPQQIMARFAARGHRVLFFSTTQFPKPGGRRYEVKALRDNVWEVCLSSPRAVDVYGGELASDLVDHLVDDLRALRRDFNINCALSVVQVATWAPLALRTREIFGWRVMYDCMDEWDTFPGMRPALIERERGLAQQADLLVVSGKKLWEKWSGVNPNTVLARNATDYSHFQNAKPGILAGIERPIIGYFGAIAEWFDLDLMTRVARARPRYSFVLVGGIFDVPTEELAGLPNVTLLGQKPYALIPSYLADFDACIIPFKVNAVTEATDPVKFYEYISRGKPVVATRMAELYEYSDLLYIAEDEADFIRKLDAAVAERDPEIQRRRIALAADNTWDDRLARIEDGVTRAHPRVSIIVVTFDNLGFTKLCLESIFANTLYPNFEVIVVDNGSADDTREYLQQLRESRGDVVATILNPRNLGFAKANNQGLAAAAGEALVLLNNDTVVPNGWLPRLLRHLNAPEVGLVVPVTNFAGNEAKVETSYRDSEGMELFAERYTRDHEGEVFDIAVAAMYCVALRRDTLEKVGPLDERFNVGMFEDDDYSHRVRNAGFRVVCAEDVFVHHFGQASFKKLSESEYQAIWDRNQRLFEQKWGPWKPHRARS